MIKSANKLEIAFAIIDVLTLVLTGFLNPKKMKIFSSPLTDSDMSYLLV